MLPGQGGDDRTRRQEHFAVAVERPAQVLGGQHSARPTQHLRVGGGVPGLAVAVHQSQTPRTIQRTGEFLTPTRARAPAPSLETITRWAVPAPRLSIASS